jgi:hypothetical protein
MLRSRIYLRLHSRIPNYMTLPSMMAAFLEQGMRVIFLKPVPESILGSIPEFLTTYMTLPSMVAAFLGQGIRE